MKDIVVSKNEDNPSVEVLPGHTVAPRLSGDQGAGFSVIYSGIDGTCLEPNKFFLHKKTVFSYSMTDGEVVFDVITDHGAESFTLREGDTITVPQNTKYVFSGKGKFFVTCCPPFDASDDYVVSGDSAPKL